MCVPIYNQNLFHTVGSPLFTMEIYFMPRHYPIYNQNLLRVVFPNFVTFLVQVQLWPDWSTMHPKFNLTGVRTHDLQISKVHFMLIETFALSTRPSVTLFCTLSIQHVLNLAPLHICMLSWPMLFAVNYFVPSPCYMFSSCWKDFSTFTSAFGAKDNLCMFLHMYALFN